MTATFVAQNNNVTVNFSYTSDTTKVIETVNACVKSLYGSTGELLPIEFEDLTNQQKLDYLDQYILNMIIEKAK